MDTLVISAAVEALRGHVIVATLRAPSAAAAVRACEALLDGGVRALEITYSTPGAASVIAAVRERHGDTALVGAGTLRRPEDVREAVDAGAEFLVSPALDDAVLEAMRASGRAFVPGAFTPTEVVRAAAAGAHVVKVFPASAVGPAYFKALHAPLPEIALMPSGGVTVDNLADWLAAGAAAVGVGGELCPSADMAAGRFDEITARARAFVAALPER
jgi:2-dehydro-3-deoxyphosphogluconate aldolase/(4S)-4-hydroxy-2-oxoglutarate aldolase